MFGRTAKKVMKTKSGRKAAIKGGKGAFRFGRSDTGQKAGKAGAKGLGRLARGAAKVKAGKGAGKVGTKGLAKAGRGAGKYALRRSGKEARVAEKNLSSTSSVGSRLLKFGFLAAVGLSIGALAGRLLGSGEESGQDSSSTSTMDRPTSGGPAGDDSQRAQSDPSSGPLIGSSHDGVVEGVTEDQPELEQRIRTQIGQDDRTKDMQGINVEVNDHVAELRGEAPSDEAKAAAGEIAAEVEGVKEVRNLIETSS
ncbi:hypothetical protein BH23ACT11_BH23ACT11_07360 [soil metagenome]